MATPDEQQAGLLFSPAHLDVAVSGPTLGLVFSQAQVSIAGSVKCKTVCGSHVTISLSLIRERSSQGDAHKTTQHARLNSKDEFLFESVIPGKYELEINAPLAQTVDDDEWCWEQKKIPVDVLTSDIGGIVFVQKGYWLRIEATHPVQAFASQDGHDSVPLQISKGWQRICIESPGVHELHFVRPCLYYGEHSYTFDTSNPKPIRLIGEKYMLSGHVHVDSRSYLDANKLESLLAVELSPEEGVLDNSPARLVSVANETSPVAIYEYGSWVKLGAEVLITPKYIRTQEETGLEILFYPRERRVEELPVLLYAAVATNELLRFDQHLQLQMPLCGNLVTSSSALSSQRLKPVS